MNVDIISTFWKTNSKSGAKVQTPEIVKRILHMSALGVGKKRIAKELGISPNTVKRYIRQNGWRPYQRRASRKKLQKIESWLERTFFKHKGNAEVVRQELLRQHNIQVSLRTVERAVRPYRQRAYAEAKATVRFETSPGEQLQIDFGSMTIPLGEEKQKVFLFVATLGYSRRQYVRAFLHERQEAWLSGLEGAFQHFNGVPEEVLLDNARALVTHHNPVTREVIFNQRFHAFSSYWNFRPRACAPYRARTKGKDENGVGYVKKNAIAGRDFSSFEALNIHLFHWLRDISDQRIHGTTGEKPIDRFLREEKEALQKLKSQPPFNQIREWQRIVHTDACVEVETNFYSVPWHLIKKEVTVQEIDGEILILLGAEEIARHPRKLGKRQRSIHREHLSGIVGNHIFRREGVKIDKQMPKKSPELLRPLTEYETVIGGGWR